MPLKNKIEELLKSRGKTVYGLIEVIEMSETGYYAMLRNNSMKVETLKKIAAWLNVSPCVFFEYSKNESFVNEPIQIYNNKLLIQAQELIEGIQKLQMENLDLKRKAKKQTA